MYAGKALAVSIDRHYGPPRPRAGAARGHAATASKGKQNTINPPRPVRVRCFLSVALFSHHPASRSVTKGRRFRIVPERLTLLIRLVTAARGVVASGDSRVTSTVRDTVPRIFCGNWQANSSGCHLLYCLPSALLSSNLGDSHLTSTYRHCRFLSPVHGL